MSARPGSTMPLFSRTKLLQKDQSDVLSIISKLALQFAVLGYIDVAFRLVSLLNKYDANHRREVILRPLWLLWDSIGSWPTGEEERAYEYAAIQQKRTLHIGEGNERAGKQAKVDMADKPITRHRMQTEIDRLAKNYACSWYWPEKKRKRVKGDKSEKIASPHERELSSIDLHKAIKAILEALDAFKPASNKDAETGAMAMDVSAGLVNALDLSITLKGRESDCGEEGPAPSPVQILGMIAKRMDANSQITYLAQSKRAWKLLKDGALAKEVSIDEAKLSEFANEIEYALQERITSGKQPLSDLPMQEILKILDNNVQTTLDAVESYTAMDEEPPKTLQKPPATESEIEAAEKRIGMKLPEDYKEFARLTNGLGAMYGGIIFEPPLHPIDSVDWFEDDEGYFYDLQLDLPDDPPLGIPEVKVGMGIEIGTFDIDNVWLIPPSKTTEVKEMLFGVLEDKEGEYSDDLKKTLLNQVKDFSGSVEEFKKLDWACVTWAAGGSACMECWPSFKAYLRCMADRGAKADKDVVQSKKFIGYALTKEGED